MTKQQGYDQAAARTFLRANGRVLERRLAEVWFADTAAERKAAAGAVLDALEAYRNADGGFGHGLESDASAPDSQPLGADVAFETYDELVAHGVLPVDSVQPAMLRTLDYLVTVSDRDGGVPIVLPSVAAHPRAEHWGSGEFPAGLNPTAGLVARARGLGLEHVWIDRAAEFCWKRLGEPDAVGDAHTALNALRFYETDPDRARAEPAYAELGARLGKADGMALLQLYPGEGYGLSPLVFAPTPASARRAFFPDDAVEAHLDALAEGQGPDGTWPISWQASSPGNDLAWRGVVTLAALRTLAAYDR